MSDWEEDCSPPVAYNSRIETPTPRATFGFGGGERKRGRGRGRDRRSYDDDEGREGVYT
ncbi:hypothetical protein GBAR_LOCUS12753 [Geodia barretti]|uniref:Uncharacterized protein n=1 Tax=Geodia barretti TaxID=519541 RepID=A0AA35S2P6_GEOBA|nr:hypothetical protein GBAR_LOCUS12753 [Geodia barretti]